MKPERRRRRMVRRAGWFRPADSVAFYPATPRGELAKEILVGELGTWLVRSLQAVLLAPQAEVRAEVVAVQAARPDWRPRLVAIAVGNHPASK